MIRFNVIYKDEKTIPIRELAVIFRRHEINMSNEQTNDRKIKKIS
jgi:hypothetical protein